MSIDARLNKLMPSLTAAGLSRPPLHKKRLSTEHLIEMKNRLFGLGRAIWLAALYPATRIRWKIVAPFVLLTLGIAMLGTYVATQLVTGSLEERFDNQLAEAARVASDAVVRRERQHLSLVRSIAFTEGGRERVEARDSSGLRELIEPLAANAQAELVEVLDGDGQRIIGLTLEDRGSLTYREAVGSVDRSDWPAVASALAGAEDNLGDKYAQIAELPEGSVLVTAGPIPGDDGVVGVVLVGSKLETFLPAAKLEALSDITIYDLEGRPLASTFVSDGGEGDLEPPASAFGSSGVAGYREVKPLFGRNFDFLYGEFRVRDQAVGLYAVALPSSFISSAGTSTGWLMAAMFAAASVAVFLIGFTVARSVTAPLLNLVRTASAVTRGDLTARSGIKSRDEVGALATSFDRMTERLAQQHLATIRALTSAIDARDPYTAGHSTRVGQLAIEIGRELELPKSDLQYLEIGGYLHDIGKIGIRDNILLKPDALTDEERALVQEHPAIGLGIVEHVDLAGEILQFVASHHEKLDGSGYPAGLDESRLTIFPRIGAVADIYDALTTDRPYRPALTVQRAVEALKRESSLSLLDPAVVEAFIRVLPAWERRLRTETALKGFRLPGLDRKSQVA